MAIDEMNNKITSSKEKSDNVPYEMIINNTVN